MSGREEVDSLEQGPRDGFCRRAAAAHGELDTQQFGYRPRSGYLFWAAVHEPINIPAQLRDDRAAGVDHRLIPPSLSWVDTEYFVSLSRVLRESLVAKEVAMSCADGAWFENQPTDRSVVRGDDASDRGRPECWPAAHLSEGVSVQEQVQSKLDERRKRSHSCQPCRKYSRPHLSWRVSFWRFLLVDNRHSPAMTIRFPSVRTMRVRMAAGWRHATWSSITTVCMPKLSLPMAQWIGLGITTELKVDAETTHTPSRW